MTAGKFAYGMLFCIVIPVMLWWWTHLLPVPGCLPRVHMPRLGLAIASLGLFLMLWSMWKLWRDGGGLPMNAFPPPRRVSTGPYALTGHPIYVGFTLLVAGFSIAVGSVAGLWITTPLAALACTALVYGYESRDLVRRLGESPARPWLSIPAAGLGPASFAQRVGVMVVILGPWLVLYEAIGHVHAGPEISSWIRLDEHWPVVPWTEYLYILAYPLVVAAPLLAQRSGDLRRFAIAGLAAMLLCFWFYLSLPVITPPKPFEGVGLAADLLRLERADGLDGRAAFPSFHVAWSMIAAMTIGTRGRWWGISAAAIAIGITISCITTGMHGVWDAFAGVVVFVIAWNARTTARWLLDASQAVANAWREVRVGRVRILMHAVYAGLAAFVGAILALGLLDDRWHVPFIAVAIAGLAGACLWGQVFESSSGLSRPFGYYGHVLACVAALAVIAFTRGDAWPLAAALAAIAPWVQAFGRLRCMVQGCCHGAPAREEHGIVHTCPESRVIKLAQLGNTPVHATALYSLLLNVLIGGPLLRMWSAGADASLIVGASLILSGLGRFVEESYRGEPQTAIIKGLRAYQWLAILMIAAGMGVMMVETAPVVIGTRLEGVHIAVAAALAVLYGAAMGVDLPGSRWRLSRLA
ncbi:MAG TPA: prolipoprotein diacylglyceryl transferase family protein [Phycisphaerales bacterium]|nr:prolipoprotein diacylglyceryl transferase family protein [Phycisphaerales bacterium]